MQTTRVNELTTFNRRELAKLPDWDVRGTYATYPGDARTAGQTVEQALRDAMTAHGGSSTEYRSLIAVRNKLAAAVRDGHPKVIVSGEPDPAPVELAHNATTRGAYTTLHTLTPAQKRSLPTIWKQSGSTATYPGTTEQARDNLHHATDRQMEGHPARKPLLNLLTVLEQCLTVGRHARVTPGTAPKPEPTAQEKAAGERALRGLAEHLAREDNVVPIRPASPTSIRNVRVPDHLWEAAKQVAESRSETVSAILVSSLRNYVEQYRGALDSPRVTGEQELF